VANLTSHVGFPQKRCRLRSHESLIFGDEQIDMAPNTLQANLKFYVHVTLLQTHRAVKTRVKLNFTARYLPARSMVLNEVRSSGTSCRGMLVKCL
jgi:hypothetical protein